MAVRTARESFAKVLPPASPFSELLRRSKFATFDPEIRQAYTAPPSYIYRGNWGLKRPLANRKRHGYIVLKNFEEHAHYIEWDNAEEQVRFLKRVEEMNLTPKLVTGTPWVSGLGPLASSKFSGLDSEFCPGEKGSMNPKSKTTEEAPQPHALASQDAVKLPPVPLNLPPSKGRGQYGANADPDSGRLHEAGDHQEKTFLQPNFSAMTPAEFKRYIKKLRTMRPEFLAYLRADLKIKHSKRENAFKININPDHFTDDELVARVGRHYLSAKLHLRFLAETSDAEYHIEPQPEPITGEEKKEREQEAMAAANKPQPIRPQPHKLGGMMYAAPTSLETYYSVKPQPGLILQINHNGRYDREAHFIAAFGGLSANINHLGPGAKPIFNTSTGADLENVASGERKMIATELKLERPPGVVGRAASSLPLREVVIRATVVDESAADASQKWRENPYKPGSFEYNALQPAVAKRATPPPVSVYGTGSKLYDAEKNTNLKKAVFPSQINQQPDNKDTLSRLRSMSNSWGRTYRPGKKASESVEEGNDVGRDGETKS